MTEHLTPRGLRVPDAAVSFSFSRSGGPGGQHVNTSSTKVRVTIDLVACGFDEARLERLVQRLGPEVHSSSEEHRSQWRNRQLALQRALVQIDRALEVPRTRRASKPSLGARNRRLEAKSRQSQRKVERRRPTID